MWGELQDYLGRGNAKTTEEGYGCFGYKDWNWVKNSIDDLKI